jgi:hypothetical protein
MVSEAINMRTPNSNSSEILVWVCIYNSNETTPKNEMVIA